jgi:hypothetical protein
MICPVCKLELGVERRADEVVLAYSFKDWGERCRCRAGGDPVWCGHLLPTILKQLQRKQGRAIPIGTPHEGWAVTIRNAAH